MEKNWEPDAALIDQASDYGISKSFVLSQLDDFVHLHREKSDTSYSWGVKFLRFVIKKWRSQEISDFKKLKRKTEFLWVKICSTMKKTMTTIKCFIRLYLFDELRRS